MTDPSLPSATPTASRHLISGTIVSDGVVIEDGLVAVDGDRIAFAGPRGDFDEHAFDGFAGLPHAPLPADRFLLPGFVDVHCHGGNGGDFPGGDEESARKAIDFLHRSGTTTLLASMVTASREDLLRGIGLYVRLAEEGLLAGIHLEGPFLSHARCGAQNPDYLLKPDLGLLAELIDAAAGKLATMTYAPELPGAAGLVDLMTSHGVTPSLGHTDCDDATASASLAAAREGLASAGFDGVSSLPTVTHLFNGMPPLHHRSPGPVAACLRAAQAGKAVVELIADGTHLAPATVATVFQLVGAANIALVTDSMAAAGLSDGNYMLGPSPVTVSGGVATLDANGSIAGGTATMLDVVRRTVASGVGLADAVFSATAVPAAVLGLSDEVGGLRRGLRADLVVVGKDLDLAAVLRQGNWL
ncbi:N-acetylglucosamine-6-phosphate deacetylase [Arthrobacter silvisoli]|uniref:N-acetylglucosamine-6-phosphate deacetylase n=1 Tax=Arthrobacter silvisoli TaxID=2291022 RepID=UPI000E21858E|nr:amidohydrolase family protein [Arthrobacter silvisoli]